MVASVRLLAAAPLLLLLPVAAAAEPGVCHTVNVAVQPQAASGLPLEEPSQMVVWVETTDGQYVDTIFITQQTGRFGLGNRPGRFDFNSGPEWPYGRRLTTFPVWAHKHGYTFDVVEFQNAPPNPFDCFNGSGADYQQCGENNLSHPFNQSSREQHFCQPLMPSDGKWTSTIDTMTCATQAFTDKGKFAPGAPSNTAASLYPPRTDLARTSSDSSSVDMYKQMNPFDAVSQATPPEGTTSDITWPIPDTLPMGDYVMFIEVSRAFDTNAMYNSTAFPSPTGISWADYGIPYRGQPSVVYKVPFTIGLTDATTGTAEYAGYGDPTGQDGVIRPPDATITTDTPGSGASRLQIMTDGNRVTVNSHPEFDSTPPADPTNITAIDTESTTVTLGFSAPGDDGIMGKVTKYEVRYRVNEPVTDANFDDQSTMTLTDVTAPVDAGQVQTIDLTNLLPETTYYIGVRADDNCHNSSHVASAKVTTLASKVGEVDACFVATAAYGSLMANDVQMLRHFRDSFLQRTALGELFVESYYTFGPGVAGVISQSELLRATARDALSPVVAFVRRLSFR